MEQIGKDIIDSGKIISVTDIEKIQLHSGILSM